MPQCASSARSSARQRPVHQRAAPPISRTVDGQRLSGSARGANVVGTAVHPVERLVGAARRHDVDERLGGPLGAARRPLGGRSEAAPRPLLGSRHVERQKAAKSGSERLRLFVDVKALVGMVAGHSPATTLRAPSCLTWISVTSAKSDSTRGRAEKLPVEAPPAAGSLRVDMGRAFAAALPIARRQRSRPMGPTHPMAVRLAARGLRAGPIWRGARRKHRGQGGGTLHLASRSALDAPPADDFELEMSKRNLVVDPRKTPPARHRA